MTAVYRSTGLTLPGSAVSDGLVGAVAWANPENVLAEGSPASSAVLLVTQLSHYLRVSDLGFALPATANVGGIGVTIDRKGSALSSARDNQVRVCKAGSPVGDDRASAEDWPDATATKNYGDISGSQVGDLWGTTWTTAEVNASGFGAALSANALLGVTASVDHVKVIIWYQVPEMIGPTRRHVKVGNGMGRSG